ncbi:PorP/SprF family type IX secretion system membrane protein [Microscilla marina]|nr:type IX secretion system membrane protein PorP/SprF [Microscilla marina]
MLKRCTFLIFMLLILCKAQAQDAQFSQYYAAPLYINPAFAGSDHTPRLVLNYRRQWQGLDASFTTYSGSFDHYFENFNSSIGLIYTYDEISNGGTATQDVGLQYAYEMDLGQWWLFGIEMPKMLRMGLQGSYVLRSSVSNLTFGDQFDNNGIISTTSNDPTTAVGGVNYANVAAGALLYDEYMWLGFSAHNLTRPNQSFLANAEGESRLPIRYTLQAGVKIPIGESDNWRDKYRSGYREMSISPTILYKHQGGFDQLDAGVYWTYSPFTLGLFYRGLPIKKVDQLVSNNESLIAMAGLRLRNFSLGYSYDFTISKLTNAATTGVHEISLRINFISSEKWGVKRKLSGGLPCPSL